MSHFRKQLQLFRHRNFCWYLLSCILANIGSGLSYITISWLVLDNHRGIHYLAMLMVCYWMPSVIFGPIAGVFVDRFPQSQKILAASRSGSALAIAIFAMLMLNQHVLLDLYILGIILGTTFSINGPASFRLTRKIVPTEELMYANTIIDSIYQTGNIIGMGFAGILIKLISAPGALIVNVIMFSLSAAALLCIKQKNIIKKTTKNPVKAEDQTIKQDLKKGLGYIVKNKTICIIYSIQLILFLEYLTAPVLLAPYARQQLHTNAAQFGYIETAMSIGIVCGGLFFSWLANKIGLLKTAGASSIILAICYGIFSYNHNLYAAEILYFIMGICFASWPLIITQAQRITETQYQGRVQACFNSISSLAIIGIYLLVILFSLWISIQQLYWLETALSTICAILIIRFAMKKSSYKQI